MSRLLPVRTHTGLSEELLHRYLAGTHPSRLSPALDAPDWERDQERELAARRLERDFVERERPVWRVSFAACPRKRTSSWPGSKG